MAKSKKMVCASQVAAVFEKPGMSSGRVGQLWRGQEVSVVEKKGSWVRITKPAGWVLQGHLKDTPAAVEKGS